MFKRLFQSSPQEDEVIMIDESSPVPPVPPESQPAEPERTPPPAPAGGGVLTGRTVGFEQIYQSAAVKPPRLSCGVLNVADMAKSPHLSGMSQDAKRCAILMALDSAGALIEDVLQDAMIRQRALNEFEAVQEKALQEFEAVKAKENNRIQAELDRLTAQFMSRIQANRDEVAHEQDSFRIWQQRKQEESQRIAEAAAFCVRPATGAPGSGGLAALFQQVTNPRT
jgi:hypothetical protein